MDIVTIIREFVFSAGPLAGLAALALVMLDRAWKDRLRAEQRHAENLAELQKQTLEALRANTAAVTRLTERLERS